MKIIKYKKMSRGRYKVTFDTQELILYEDVIIKNNLLLEKNITIELLEKVINENIYYEVYDNALTQIEYKMRTTKELKEILQKKNFSSSIIDEVIEKLKKEGYLNEEKYIEAYINDKINLSKDGPFKIKKSLELLDLDSEKINNYLESIDEEIWDEKLQKIINKKLNLMKNKSLSTIKNKLKIELFNLGYDNSKIEYYLNKIEKDDGEIIEKEYDKIYKKYSKKYNGNTLIMKIRNYLFTKGYNIDEINKIIEKNKN